MSLYEDYLRLRHESICVDDLFEAPMSEARFGFLPPGEQRAMVEFFQARIDKAERAERELAAQMGPMWGSW